LVLVASVKKQKQEQRQKRRTGVSALHENEHFSRTSVTDSIAPSALESLMTDSSVLARKYEYHRRMPHYQKPGRAIFVTFCKNIRDSFPEAARDQILVHCRHDHGKRIDLHAAVVMPDHVHLLLTPLRDDQGWPYPLPAILKLIKGVSARSVNKLLGVSGPVWQEESFEHTVRNNGSFQEKLEYIRQNPVRRGLVAKPEDYPWLWIAPK
jgi:REP element-mobilizing transposase RayT